MEQEQVGRNILAIECAVGSGSVAILRGTSTLVSVGSGNDKPSRAEEVMTVIDAALNTAGSKLRDVDDFVVSSGPGSYSGIRIGMATALGLARSMSKTPVGVSVLDALTLEARAEGMVLTAVEVGKRHTAWASYEISGGMSNCVGPALLKTDDDFIAHLQTLSRTDLIWSVDLAERLSHRLPGNVSGGQPGRTIAELIGAFSARFPQRTSMTPQYLREQQPARSG